MPGDDPQQGAGGAQVEEGAAFEREERRPLRGDQPHHPHGLRPEPAGARLQPARPVPRAPRDQPQVSGGRGAGAGRAACQGSIYYLSKVADDKNKNYFYFFAILFIFFNFYFQFYFSIFFSNLLYMICFLFNFIYIHVLM